ncbi:hypothetical protein EDD18DRAFT_1357814 [Armillaria luteobubalina]|uniref:Uncharacterized protein n=1 Tax=Armillaria luteobubalina TaxID=153913 RepID=A0AA39PXR4_9AGAR|nr:hypothetical protein EDD18DRAFT_1357814 [Armillaria luteobubalina]
MFDFFYKFSKALLPFCTRGRGTSRSFSLFPLPLSSPPARFSSHNIPFVGVPTLAKIKPQYILAHLQMAQSEQANDPSQINDTTASTDASGSVEPKGPTALQRSLARGKYYAGLESLSQLQEAPPQSHWTSARVDQWIREAKKLWSRCGAQVVIAKISAKEFRGVEFEFLQLLVDFPDERIGGAFLEYNELITRARQYNIKVFPLPVPADLVPEPIPASRPASQAPVVSTAELSVIGTQENTTSASRTSKSSAPLANAPPVVKSGASQGTAPSKASSDTSSTGPQRPKLTLHGPRPPIAAQDPVFTLDPTSPLHPAATNVVTLPPSSNPFTDPFATRRPNPLLGVRRPQGQAAINPPPPPTRPDSRPQPRAPLAPILPDPDPINEGSVTSSSRRRTPLFFPGTDDEDDLPTPVADKKGKGKEIIQGTDEDEEDFQGSTSPFVAMDVDEDDVGSPPLTNVARRYRSPILPGANPIPVSELLGAPTITRPKKGSQRKPKFDNPPLAPNDSAAEGTVKASRASEKALKASKDKEVGEVSKGEVVATKAIRPRGPSRIKPPLASMGIQSGGFGEDVPTDLRPIKNGLKSIGGTRGGTFRWRTVREALRSMLSQEDAVPKVLDELGTVSLNPLHHYRPKEYQSINAFESAMTTLTQHANNLEDVVVNYMAGIDAMTQLQGLRTQIGHLRECLGADTRVEDVVEEDDDEVFQVDDVAEGEPGPSRKRKRSGK